MTRKNRVRRGTIGRLGTEEGREQSHTITAIGLLNCITINHSRQMSVSTSPELSSDLYHSQQDKVPTLRTPSEIYLKSHSQNVFDRLTASASTSEQQSPLLPTQDRPHSYHMNEIEDLLMQKQAQTQAKLKLLRAKKEDQQKEEMRQYPKISNRSRVLAEKANARFFSRFNIKPITAPPETPKIVAKQRENETAMDLSWLHTPDTSNLPKNEEEDFGQDLKDEIEFLEPDESENPVSHEMKPRLKERIRQYLDSPNRSVDETIIHPRRGPIEVAKRGKNWVLQRDQKLKAKSEEKPWTFTPVIYTKIPHHLHNRSAEDLVLFASEASATTTGPNPAPHTPTPQTLGNAHKRAFSYAPKPAISTGSVLSPVVRKVAYESGCDWMGLMQRTMIQNR